MTLKDAFLEALRKQTEPLPLPTEPDYVVRVRVGNTKRHGATVASILREVIARILDHTDREMTVEIEISSHGEGRVKIEPVETLSDAAWIATETEEGERQMREHAVIARRR